jgi:hypothetical protein
MAVQSPAFLLRVADALIEEVEQKTDSVLEAVRTLERREGFMESLKGALAAGALVGELQRNLKLAIQLADRAAQMDPNAREEELTPSVVKARALFQLGVIAMGQRKFKEAVWFFEESLKQTPTQSTYLNMAYCFMQMKGPIHRSDLRCHRSSGTVRRAGSNFGAGRVGR